MSDKRIVPQKEIGGVAFFPVPEFSDSEVFRGAEGGFISGVPIPEKFEMLAEKLFFEGGEFPELNPRVNREKAMRAVGAWLGSFAPSHEEKINTVGYALWLWTSKTLDGEEK